MEPGRSVRIGFVGIVFVGIGLLVQSIAAFAQELTVARLEGASPTPDVVVAGAAASRFVAQRTPTIFIESRAPTWWRVTADTAHPAAEAPQLVLLGAYLSDVEAWQPGAVAPTRHSMYGPLADRRYSTRAVVIPLEQGLDAQQSVYLRITARSTVPIRVAIEPLVAVHQADLSYVAFRTMLLTSMVVLCLLALGSWAGIGDRSYVFFAGMLLGEAAYLASAGGELRDVPLLEWFVAGNAPIARMTLVLSAICCIEFSRRFLDLKRRQPLIDQVLRICALAFIPVAVTMVFTTARWVASIGNIVFATGAVTLLYATVRGSLRRQRAAHFMLFAWLPTFLLSIARALEMLGWVVMPSWIDQLFPASLALSGFLLTIGLAEHMLQLRRDRDRATQLAAQDSLTETLSRRGIEQRLQAEVEQAHATSRPLSVAFLDFDHFKQINDSHGHTVGDQCLRIMCHRVRGRARHRDVLGRYGGDELLILLPDTEPAEALAICEEIRRAVSGRPLAVEGLVINGSLSIGVAALAAKESAAALLERADAALYASKKAGRDRVTAAHSTQVQGPAYA